MKETDKLLITAYASFVVNTETLDVLEYNDYGSRLLGRIKEMGRTLKISDVVIWDENLPREIFRRKDKRIITKTKLSIDGSEIVMITQHMLYNDQSFYNVTLIDNLEDLQNLETNTFEMEISGNSLFSNIFKYSPIGLVLVDNERRLYKANKYMFDCFELKYKENIGDRFGNVFMCSAVAGSKVQCGKADGCKSCKFRGGIHSVLNDNKTLEGVEIAHEFEIGGRIVRKWFTVSASPVSYGTKTYALLSFVDITQRVRMEERLRELGITDGLTKLYNRRHIMQLLSDALENNQGFKTMSLALIDIDDFKIVNDTYGHLVGDDVLILLANILKTQVRFSDYVGRYGGEEFLVVFTDTNLRDADNVLLRIQQELRARSIELVSKSITFSSGLVEVDLSLGVNSSNANELLQLTDRALYDAKAAGKDCIKVASYSADTVVH